MMTRRYGLPFFAALLLGVPALAQQRSDDAINKGLYETALKLYKGGNVEQALKDFEQIYTQSPSSAWADDALISTARHYYPAEWIGDFPPARDAAKTRQVLVKITTSYLSADRTPEAFIMLGMMSLDPNLGAVNYDEASANFFKVRSIYPQSDYMDDALFGLGYTALQQLAYGKAAGYLEALLVSYPRSAYVPRALYFAAEALAFDGQPAQAFFYLARLQRDFPGHAYAQRATSLAGLLARFQFPHQYKFSGSFPLNPAEPWAKVSILRTSRDGSLLAAESVKRTAARFDAGGNLLQALGGQKVSDLCELPDGRIALADENAVIIGSQPIAVEEDTPREMLLHPPSRLAVLQNGAIVVYSSRRQSVLSAGPDGKVRSTLAAKITRDPYLARDDRGRLWILNVVDKSLRCLNPDGSVFKEVKAERKGGLWDQPACFAFDMFGNLYVLDTSRKAVLVFSPEMEPLRSIQPGKDDPGEMKKPTAMTVLPSGTVLVFDETRKEVLRYD